MRKLALTAALHAYLRHHAYTILSVCCAFGIFAAVFSLYSLPLEAVVYACVLTAACFMVIGGIRFAAFANKHRELVRMRERIALNVDAFPPAENIIEEDYQALIAILDENRRHILSETDRLRTDTADYHSLWAHQIKTPIAAVGLLLQSEVDSESKREISRQLLRIEQYVDMVLGYLRIESPSSDLVIAEYPLDDIVRQAVRKLSKLFIHSKTKLELAENLATVLTDEKWLCFVIEQLLTNAVKYAPGGTISICMEGSETLVIRDTGIGIAPEDLPRVFEKGYTGYNGRTGQKSTGIGLYLCKKVLDKLSHTIRLASRPGVGTTVRIGFHVTKL